MGVPLKKQL